MQDTVLQEPLSRMRGGEEQAYFFLVVIIIKREGAIIHRYSVHVLYLCITYILVYGRAGR